MRYGDHTSAVALWWKVIFLLPLWGVIPVCIIGFIATRLGNAFVEVSLLFIVFMGIAYFIEDVLKRKLKISDGVLYFGYKKLPLNRLKSLGVAYEDNKIIPRDLLFTFQNGYLFYLELSRIDAIDVQYIVKLVDSKFPHCTVDSTLRTLARCQELSPRLRTAITEPAELPYHSNKALIETIRGFKNTFRSWSRLGPVLAFIALIPVWMAATLGSFSIFRAWVADRTTWLDNLGRLFSYIYGIIGNQISYLCQNFTNAASHPTAGVIASAITVILLIHVLRKLGKPSIIVLDNGGIRFFQGYKQVRFETTFYHWSDIKKAELVRPSQETNPEQWKIVLTVARNTPWRSQPAIPGLAAGQQGGSMQCILCPSSQLMPGFDKVTLEYSALEPKGRAELYERLRHFAPKCVVDPELAEALLPKQHASYTELWLQSLSGSPKRDNLEPLEPGHLLNEGRFEVLSKLGVGGQGAAYLARENSIIDRRHCQEIVLKETIFPIFVEDSISRQSLERFEHEAKTLNALNHDHIVKLSHYFVEDHRGYLVLEHIEGKNLRDLAAGKPMSEKEVLELALQMCDMLEYLHSMSVLHRDFTPDNLIREKSGTLKLIDFNVAQTQATGMTGTVVGKHAYVPPEQFRGKPLPASDIYAMGCSLYYLLSGHDPEPITPSAIETDRSDISTATSAIIKKCTSLKANMRYEQIAPLREDLTKALMELVGGCRESEDDFLERAEKSLESHGGSHGSKDGNDSEDTRGTTGSGKNLDIICSENVTTTCNGQNKDDASTDGKRTSSDRFGGTTCSEESGATTFSEESSVAGSNTESGEDEGARIKLKQPSFITVDLEEG